MKINGLLYDFRIVYVLSLAITGIIWMLVSSFWAIIWFVGMMGVWFAVMVFTDSYHSLQEDDEYNYHPAIGAAIVTVMTFLISIISALVFIIVIGAASSAVGFSLFIPSLVAILILWLVYMFYSKKQKA